MQASHKLAEEVYKKAQKAEGGRQKADQAEPEGEEARKRSGGKDDKVVDAEFKVQEDKK